MPTAYETVEPTTALPRHIVNWEGIEPPTFGLKVHGSAH